MTNAKSLISYGRGLTPSGDDFLCGLIYCLRRKDRFLNYQQFLDQFNRKSSVWHQSKPPPLAPAFYMAVFWDRHTAVLKI